MERVEGKGKRDLELNLWGSPQARRRQVPRPPRKTTSLFPSNSLFFLPFSFPLSAMNCVPTLLLLYLFPILPLPPFVPHSRFPWSFVSISASSFLPVLSLSLSIFYEHQVHGELPGRSYNSWILGQPRPAAVHVCVCARACLCVYERVRWLTPL